jgi:hypothetical protein
VEYSVKLYLTTLNDVVVRVRLYYGMALRMSKLLAAGLISHHYGQPSIPFRIARYSE